MGVEPVESRASEIISSNPAPPMAGIASRNENRPAASRLRPSASAIVIVIPDREVPGISASASCSQHQFSMNWLGSSTASHSTLLMPAAWARSTVVSMCWSPWPNSWKRVSTSSKVIRLGVSPTGGLWLQIR